MSKGLGIKNNYKMVGVKPTVGGKQLKTIPINPQSGASKFEMKMKKGLGIPGYLTGGQTKIDANKDGKITGEDFKILQAKKKGLNQKEYKKQYGVAKANVGLLVKAITKGFKPASKFLKKRFELSEPSTLIESITKGGSKPSSFLKRRFEGVGKKTAIAGGAGAAVVGAGQTVKDLKKSKEFQEGRVAGSEKAKEQLSKIKRKMGEVTGYITGKKYGGESKITKANLGLLMANKKLAGAGLLGLGMLAKDKLKTGGMSSKEKKIKKVMKEYKKGELNIGKSKKKVKNRKQAIAIALSEARKKQKSGKRKA